MNKTKATQSNSI